MSKRFLRLLPIAILTLGLTAGTAAGNSTAPPPAKVYSAAAAQAAEQTLAGKVTGKSNKAKTISLEVAGAMQMVKFNDQTRGLEFAENGEAAIVNYTVVNGDKIATEIKPKLAALPEGVTEMVPDELALLVEMGPEKGNYFLVDSRPASPFAAGHIPTAVSIPVPKFKETKGELLPADKDRQLIFYCGGVT